MQLSTLFSLSLVAALSLFFVCADASPKQAEPRHNWKRQVPEEPEGVQTLTAPQSNVTIRFKEPGKQGVCETTPGVNSYSGFVDTAEDAHTFFWFFEARENASTAPVTLWLNGGPGSDSLIGLFQELGPCNVTRENITALNPYAWNEASNLLFLSQPIGTGFSYGSIENGTLDATTGEYQNASIAGVNGAYPVINASRLDTTELAAAATWNILQGFYSILPQLDSEVSSKEFHFWTESYGGHYGPAFYRYFHAKNQLIANGSMEGIELNMASLGIINGIVDEAIQAEYYPEFAVNNTYGIRAVNDTVYNYMKFSCFMANGCLDQVEQCRRMNRTTQVEQAICAQAGNMCRDNVEGPYYQYSGRGVYDIRQPYEDPTPPDYFEYYLNTPEVQDALGVSTNYTQFSNPEISYAFQETGDFVYNTFKSDLEMLLENGVRVSLIYGDADYICNWFGGEAVSKAINYTYTKEFNDAGYAPFTVGDTEYGEVRQYGNFSFLRMYEAGHEVPFYQPEASLAAFRRVINNLRLSDGAAAVDANYSTSGEPSATHTESFVALETTEAPASTPLRSSTAEASASSSASVSVV
ncbi:MAG: hypothetical protein M1833_001378 [Piccolia ochrophora]|nr:MAG: hypothetical protein M1833_001378 [Piccolia ochrophora]